jgi:hypothetical protein
MCAHDGDYLYGLLWSCNYHFRLLMFIFGFFMLSVLFPRVLLTKVLCMVRVQLHGEDLRSLA